MFALQVPLNACLVFPPPPSIWFWTSTAISMYTRFSSFICANDLKSSLRSPEASAWCFYPERCMYRECFPQSLRFSVLPFNPTGLNAAFESFTKLVILMSALANYGSFFCSQLNSFEITAPCFSLPVERYTILPKVLAPLLMKALTTLVISMSINLNVWAYNDILVNLIV